MRTEPRAHYRICINVMFFFLVQPFLKFGPPHYLSSIWM
jgi:hypothetical protein